MKIGLPRALPFYGNGVLWRVFFDLLGAETVVGPETDAEILKAGIVNSADECCLSAKLYVGHIAALVGKCDYILAPRFDGLGRGEFACTKFNALPDIARNTFPSVKFLHYNVDEPRGFTEKKAFIGLGRFLNGGRGRAVRAYKEAKAKQREYDDALAAAAEAKLSARDGKIKILLAAHDYNARDRLLGGRVAATFGKLGADVVFSSDCDGASCARRAAALSPSLFWRANKEIAGAVSLNAARVDGVVFMGAFPCGPDSLVNEIIRRRIRGVPMLEIIADEHNSDTGLLTRAESFCDMLSARRARAAKAGSAKVDSKEVGSEEIGSEEIGSEEIGSDSVRSEGARAVV